MGLFQTKTLEKPDNMISAGVILTPSVLTSSSQEPYARSSNGPAINPTAPQSVTPQNATTKIPGRTINFVENYKNWCVSPVLNNIYKQEIKLPIIRFKEYRLLTSTLWEQAKYFTFIAATAPGRLADDVRGFLGSEESSEDNYIVKGLEAAQEAIDTKFSQAKEMVGSLNINTPDFDRASDEDPYEGIYSPEKTGFEYTFPYYTSLLIYSR